jgi:3-deoxy-D-manno-octulosonic-acid transferase
MEALDAGAAVMSRPESVVAAALDLLSNGQRQQQMAKSARSFVNKHQGATFRVVAIVEKAFERLTI